jgi:hypothetical protein
MANPVPSNFTTDCYSLQTLNTRQQKALMVYAKALAVKAIGGGNPDYTASLTSQLFTDAAAATIGLDQARRDAARVKIAFVFALTLGATFPGNIDDKLAQVKCLVNVPDEQLDNMLVYLDQYIAQTI